MAQVTIDQAMQIAVRHHQAGRFHQAEQIYRQILAQAPQHAPALHHLGLIAHQAGRYDITVDLIRQAIALNPDLSDAHYNLGVALQANGQLDEAIAVYRQAVAVRPSHAEAYNNLGTALKDKGLIEESIAVYRQAIAQRPSYVEAHSNLGVALSKNGQLDEAIAVYRQAIALRPAYPEAFGNLGTALKDKGEFGKAIDAYRQAIALNPYLPKAHSNLGNALRFNGQVDEAIATFRAFIALRPDLPEAHGSLGNALKDNGQLDEAIAAFSKANALGPNSADTHSSLVYTLHFHAAYDASSIAEENRRWNERHALPLRKFFKPHKNNPISDRRLKIGYVSPYFCDHVVGRNLLPLIREHDRQRFEVFCYSNGTRRDRLTEQFVSYSDNWRTIVGKSDDAAAQLVQQDGIDILIDLALHLADNRLQIFSRKPAPVQVTFAGYPGSTGLDAIDYRLTDPYLDPSGQDDPFYSEQSISLPDSFWCYDPAVMTGGTGEDRPVGPLPALGTGSVTFGCLNNFCKVNQQVLALWARVLKATPGSKLMLMAPLGSAGERTLETLRREGIDAARIEFVTGVPRGEYLQRYGRIDIALDTFPYNGHTTNLDALWMGVPVVTLVGKTVVGRAGLSQLTNLKLTELAARSEDQYVHIATELAGDLSRLAALRAGLRQRMRESPLTDAPRFARNIESAYREMWRKWCATAPEPTART